MNVHVCDSLIAKSMHHDFKCINDFIDHVDIGLRPRKVVRICLF